MKLVVRLLTEMLEVRIVPGEPKLFGVEHSALDRMREHAQENHRLQTAEARPRFWKPLDVNNRCHKNVIVASNLGNLLCLFAA
jgi:hypothetical protein